ncbi:MAG: DUF4399 domain-containing protein [Mariprofundaceae bacterium]|nr:DUF4399 domain-containing protein [Mariprofundaceae bacterium]
MMKKYSVLFFMIMTFSMQAFASEVIAETELTPEKLHVNFVMPKQGDIVAQSFDVEMGVTGMDVEPAGEVRPSSGHHHLIIDGQFIPSGQTVPKDETHQHFGKGQTKTTLTLTPGEHTLTLQFADGFHRSYGQNMSQTIKITVK